MPKFIDRHPTNPNLPPEIVTSIKEQLRGGQADQFGERGINVFIGRQQTYCYTEAPDAEAVQKAHAAMGIALVPEDIDEVQVLP